VRMLQKTYKLQEDTCRILIGLRLKGKALAWFHSRPENIAMPVEELFTELRGMFYRRPNRVAARREFEARVWKKNEKFSEYLHEKTILANLVPISEDELIDYLIDGITDPVLRDQARIHRFMDKSDLLEAFEKVTLRGGPETRAASSGNIGNSKEKASFKSKKIETKKETEVTPGSRRCHSCGASDHLFANCPTKSKGVKCFECREYGHYAGQCPKKSSAKKDSCDVSHFPSRKYYKEIKVNGQASTALIDTGSDLSLIRADQYIKLGTPKLKYKEIKFCGVGSDENKTLGEFCSDVEIDGNHYNITFHVVSDTLTKHSIIIGTNFLDSVSVLIEGHKNISIRQPQKTSESESVPEVFAINCIREVNEIDLSHIPCRELRNTVENMINNYNPVKSREVSIEMNLVLKDSEPVYQRARRLSPRDRTEVDAQVSEWLREGIIQPSLSEYASPVVLVQKKNGKTRLCVDYRKLNKKVIKDRYPLPLIEDQIDALQEAVIFTTLDLKNGFFHVPMGESSRQYTAFVIPTGQYEFRYVPFGLCNSPAIFQRYINTIFRELIDEKIVLAYMDDLIIPSADLNSGVNNLARVLSVAEEYGLKINWEKCTFLQSRIEFLGYIIEAGNIYPSEKKTKAVMKFPGPTNVKRVQSFLGLTGYFRKFIPNYSLIARPLTNLLKSNSEFVFGENERLAFNQLKFALSNKPVLQLYKATLETELHTDASMHGYGAILLQRNDKDGLFHPVYYASGKTTTAESKYSSYELEVLAIIKALRKFRVYLLGISFKIITDCQAFSLTMSKKDLCVRVARWALLLEEFHYTIEHRPGRNMLHVDALSRNPLPTNMVIDESTESLHARIGKAQREDNNIEKLFAMADQRQCEGYIVRGGLLFKESEGDIRLVIPKSMRKQIIRQVHDRGHFSIGETETLLKRDYWFPNMRSKIEKVVHNCVACILAEKKCGKLDGWLNPIDKGNVPLDVYHIDHLGPLASTKKNYRFILVVTDAFSKFI